MRRGQRVKPLCIQSHVATGAGDLQSDHLHHDPPGIICVGIVADDSVLGGALPRPPRPERRAAADFGNTRLEIAWTVIPLIIVTVLFGTSVTTMLDSSPGQVALQGGAAHNPDRIHVIGHQWWWEIRYPLASSPPTRSTFRSASAGSSTSSRRDVIHSLWIPNAGPKSTRPRADKPHMVGMPIRRESTTAIAPSSAATGHAWMLVDVVGRALATFQAWERQGAAAGADGAEPQAGDGVHADEVVAGARLFQSFSCQGCHYIQGVTGKRTQPTVDYAPDLTHMGSRLRHRPRGWSPIPPIFMEQLAARPRQDQAGRSHAQLQLSTPQPVT